MKQLIKQKYLASVFLFMVSQAILLSTQPDWWADYFLVDGSTPQDTAVVTHGQAKHAVQKAYQYLEAELSEVGGAGTAITALYTTYCTNAPTDAANDRLPLSIGQLKYLTKPFYDRLNSATVAFDTSVMNPVSTDIYPWTVDQSDDADLTLATIGQLKFVLKNISLRQAALAQERFHLCNKGICKREEQRDTHTDHGNSVKQRDNQEHFCLQHRCQFRLTCTTFKKTTAQ